MQNAKEKSNIPERTKKLIAQEARECEKTVL